MTLFLILLIAIAVWLFISYNKLRALAENVKRRQANIAATVKKRHDIAQRLSDIAASYGDHEKLTHFTVVEGEQNMHEASAAAADAARVIGNVQMLANRFPELKANATYQQLMVQLDEIESTILERREAYNEAAQNYNATRGSLPHLFYADALGFTEAPYFAVDDGGAEQMASFRTDDGKILRETMGRMANLATTHAQSAAERIKATNDQLRNGEAGSGEAAPDGGSAAGHSSEGSEADKADKSAS
ncbi:LemA family protein [Altericroceibacterium spongiae]|uniref:LemA family protein n=1 Tax=Altericroceibacterium spongiae TaxID=2320269 RepID=A0A420EFB5_9SPHN|nr:LemA family protein [Altericroceibacterium spongiae]RKF19391.1 LemA family protein [Altericroceibacterium spongiae]